MHTFFAMQPRHVVQVPAGIENEFAAAMARDLGLNPVRIDDDDGDDRTFDVSGDAATAAELQSAFDAMERDALDELESIA